MVCIYRESLTSVEHGVAVLHVMQCTTLITGTCRMNVHFTNMHITYRFYKLVSPGNSVLNYQSN